MVFPRESLGQIHSQAFAESPATSLISSKQTRPLQRPLPEIAVPVDLNPLRTSPPVESQGVGHCWVWAFMVWDFRFRALRPRVCVFVHAVVLAGFAVPLPFSRPLSLLQYLKSFRKSSTTPAPFTVAVATRDESS